MNERAKVLTRQVVVRLDPDMYAEIERAATTNETHRRTRDPIRRTPVRRDCHVRCPVRSAHRSHRLPRTQAPEDDMNTLSLDQPPTVRAVMRVLANEFHYREEPDAAQWLVADALSITTRIDDGWPVQAAVVAGLNDTARVPEDEAFGDLGGLVARVKAALS